MTDSTIQYKPNRAEGSWVPILVVIAALALFASGYNLHKHEIPLFVLYLISALFVSLSAKLVYNYSKVTVFFEQGGIRIIHDKQSAHRFIPWENFVYAYTNRSFRKGHEFIILSPNPLTTAQQIDCIYRATNTNRVFLDDMSVIFLDPRQDTTPIRTLIQEKF